MKTTDPGDAARIELLLAELRLPAVKPDLDSRTGFRHREWQKCWRLIEPGQKCGAKL